MPEVAKRLLKEAQEGVLKRWKMYEYLALPFEKKIRESKR
jgi:pyruvate-ferredoxin/flavodoxin oxidoreductase